MSPVEIGQLLMAAQGHHQAGHRAEAEGLYRQVLSRSPSHHVALQLLGVLAMQDGRLDLAVDCLRQSTRIQPTIPEYHGNLGNALKEQGRFDEAIASYRRALELKPTLAEAHNNLGVALQAQGKDEEAIDSYKRALSLKPDHANAYSNLGFVLQRQGKANEAIAACRRALELKPGLAEAYVNLGNALKDQGNLTAAADALGRALALSPADAQAYFNLGIVLQAQEKLDEAIHCYRQALHFNPGFAEAYLNMGNAFKDQGKPEETIACCRQALAVKPDFADAFVNMGDAFKKQGKFDDAIANHRRALAFKPDHAEAYGHLGVALMGLGKVNEAAAAQRQALTLKPAYAEAHDNLGIALMYQGKQDEAEAHFDEAIRLRPDYADSHFNRSMLYLARGDFARGWPAYEYRWQANQSAPRRAFAQPQWDGSPLHGRTILLYAEQGFGDTLQFIRYAPLVAESGGNVVVVCQPELKRLLQNSLEQIPVIGNGQPLPSFDVHCPLLSLPLAFQTTLQTIPRQVPYLQANAESIAQWRNKLAGDVRFLTVGLVWTGSRSHTNDNRSLAPSALAPLSQIPGVRFVSLQKGEATPPELQLIDWTNDLHDFADTAALIANLDLVISVDTAVAHLAGALGKPVWVLAPFVADWRWLLDRDDSPWYPTMRLFRQPREGDWESVMVRVADAVAGLALRGPAVS